MIRGFCVSLAALTAGCSSSPKSSIDTANAGDTADTATSWSPTPPTEASAGGCEWVNSYCYDFTGSSWTPATAEDACDQISANLVASGAVPGVFVSSGCPTGATAECTGIGSDPADPGSEFVIYYYDTYPLTVAEDACVSGGDTYTEL